MGLEKLNQPLYSMNYARTIFLFWLLIFHFPLFSQHSESITLTGKITDTKLNPLHQLTVSLHTFKDSLLLSQTLTKENGEFQIKTSPGYYFIKISALEYASFKTSAIEVTKHKPEMALSAIVLQPKINSLKEVVITSKTDALKVKDGKLIYNIEQSPAASGSSALELLQRTPGVSVDQNESILLKGSSAVNVLVDGKMNYLSAQQLSNMLKGMNSSNISRIEISNTPTAEFDASGNAGIINIITKKSTKKGYAADISAGIGAGHYLLNRESITGNIKTQKFNFYGNLGYDHRHSLARRNGQQIRLNNNETLLYQRKIADEMQTYYYSYRAGLDLYLKKNMELGFSYNGYTDDWNRNSGGPTTISGIENVPQSTIQNRNILKEPYYNNGYNLNYKASLDTIGTVLGANADYMSYRNNSDGSIGNTWKDVNGNDLQAYQQLNFHQPSTINIRSIKTDLEFSSKAIQFKAGLKYSSVTINNDFKYDSLINNALVFAPTLSDHFVYEEQISAVYFSADKKWKSTSINAGLRLEHTLSDGNSISTNTVNSRKYTNLFPSLSLNHEINSNHKLAFSVSSRINRPAYSNLNPVRYFSDKYAYFQGNPNLKPEIAWVSSITYSLYDKYIATLSYNRSNNFIAQSAILDNSSGILITSNANFSKRSRYDLLIVSPTQITSFWNTTNTINLSYTSYPLQEIMGLQTVSKTAVDFISNHNFDLPKKIKFELTAHYTSPTLNGAYIHKHFFSVDGGFKKSFLNKKLDARFSFSDLFRTIRYQGYTITNTATTSYSTKPDSRRINLTVIYHLGGKLSGNKTQRIEEADRL
jgi:outer membrane receptor protein involved in Fe transport